jgi:hypothetical protein
MSVASLLIAGSVAHQAAHGDITSYWSVVAVALALTLVGYAAAAAFFVPYVLGRTTLPLGLLLLTLLFPPAFLFLGLYMLLAYYSVVTAPRWYVEASPRDG